MKKAILFLLMGTALFVSCGKDEETPASQTKAEMIARTWEVQSGIMSVGGSPNVTGYTKGNAGNLVDMSQFRLEFKSDGTFVQTSLDGAASTGTWALSENDTKLTLTTTQFPSGDTWKVDNLAAQNLDISREIAGNSTAPGDQYWINLIEEQIKDIPTLPYSPRDGVKIAVKTIPVQ